MLKLYQRKEKIGRYEPQWSNHQGSWKVSSLKTTCSLVTEATITAGTLKTLPVSQFGLPLYKVDSYVFIYDCEIISQKNLCEVRVPLLFWVLMTRTFNFYWNRWFLVIWTFYCSVSSQHHSRRGSRGNNRLLHIDWVWHEPTSNGAWMVLPEWGKI